MRPIKFRGKRVDNGEWVYGDLIHCPNGVCAIVECEQFTVKSALKVLPETVGQFTGLCDKNGKEVYEGDIVEMILKENIGTFNVPDDVIMNGGYTGRKDVYKGVVVFDENCYFGIDDKENGIVNFMIGEHTTIEVIGNLFDNPELVEVVTADDNHTKRIRND